MAAESPDSIAEEALRKIEKYAEIGARVSERVALLNFKNSLQQAQNSILTKEGETIAASAR